MPYRDEERRKERNRAYREANPEKIREWGKAAA